MNTAESRRKLGLAIGQIADALYEVQSAILEEVTLEQANELYLEEDYDIDVDENCTCDLCKCDEKEAWLDDDEDEDEAWLDDDDVDEDPVDDFFDDEDEF